MTSSVTTRNKISPTEREIVTATIITFPTITESKAPTDDPGILELRHRQIRNFLTTLLCSQGTPFLTAGDERLRTQFGNNNTYCQDNELSWISWDDSPEAHEMREFFKRVLGLRRSTPSLRRNRFFTGETDPDTGIPDVCWLRPDGEIKESDDWNNGDSSSFGMLIYGAGEERALLFFFNARPEKTRFHFPDIDVKSWELAINTAKPDARHRVRSRWEGVKLVKRSLQIWMQA